MPWTLSLNLNANDIGALGIEAGALRPDHTATLTVAELSKLSLRIGNRPVALGEVFRVDGQGGDGELVLEGDLGNVHGLGAGMGSGRLTVRGGAGHRLGQGITGGALDVFGSVGDRAGEGMRGGLLRVRGGAGHGLGSAGPGERLGMRDGVILVEGTAGDGVGGAMRRGLIAVGGALGFGPGAGMVAGSVFAFGPSGDWPGAGMKRGTLALFGGLADEGTGPRAGLPPTFRPSGRTRPPFVAVYLRQLHAWGFPVPASAVGAEFERYNGDLLGRGQGEILLPLG